MIRAISTDLVTGLLSSRDLGVGAWNEITYVGDTPTKSLSFNPSRDATELYVIAHKLAGYIGEEGWILLQFDNSTAPLPDELELFDEIAFKSNNKWKFDAEKSLFLEVNQGDGGKSKITALIFFILLFRWHSYLVFEKACIGERIGLQDGWIHFIGHSVALTKAERLISDLNHWPLRLS